MRIYGDGTNMRDWLHVEDHARAIVALLENGTIGETYVIGAESELSNIHVARTVCRLFDDIRPQSAPHDRLIEFVADRPGHDFRYGIDPSKIRRDLGWKPGTGFDAGLSKTIAWYMDHESWWRDKICETRHRSATATS